VRHLGVPDGPAAVGFGEPDRVTVAVNNELDWTTLPTGEVRTYDDEMHPPGFRGLTWWARR